MSSQAKSAAPKTAEEEAESKRKREEYARKMEACRTELPFILLSRRTDETEEAFKGRRDQASVRLAQLLKETDAKKALFAVLLRLVNARSEEAAGRFMSIEEKLILYGDVRNASPGVDHADISSEIEEMKKSIAVRAAAARLSRVSFEESDKDPAEEYFSAGEEDIAPADPKSSSSADSSKETEEKVKELEKKAAENQAAAAKKTLDSLIAASGFPKAATSGFMPNLSQFAGGSKTSSKTPEEDALSVLDGIFESSSYEGFSVDNIREHVRGFTVNEQDIAQLLVIYTNVGNNVDKMSASNKVKDPGSLLEAARLAKRLRVSRQKAAGCITLSNLAVAFLPLTEAIRTRYGSKIADQFPGTIAPKYQDPSMGVLAVMDKLEPQYREYQKKFYAVLSSTRKGPASTNDWLNLAIGGFNNDDKLGDYYNGGPRDKIERALAWTRSVLIGTVKLQRPIALNVTSTLTDAAIESELNPKK